MQKKCPLYNQMTGLQLKLMSFMQPTCFADLSWHVLQKNKKRKEFYTCCEDDTKWHIAASDVVPKPKKRANSFGQSQAIVHCQSESHSGQASSGLIPNTADADDTIRAGDDLRIEDADGRFWVRSKQRTPKSVKSSRKRGLDEEGSEDWNETAQKNDEEKFFLIMSLMIQMMEWGIRRGEKRRRNWKNLFKSR